MTKAVLYSGTIHHNQAHEKLTMKRVVVFSENSGWHEQALLERLAARQVDVLVCSLRDCRIDFAAGVRGLVIPGFDQGLPDAAFVRAIPDGGFQQVAFRLDILHGLAACGIPVYNPPTAIEYTVDKGMTTFLLLRNGIPTPPTRVCESRDDAGDLVARENATGNRMVLKPLFGNCGRGLQLIDRPEQLPLPEDVDGIYYLQRYIRQGDGSGRDWRVFVINGLAVAAMERVSGHWITNRARGGRCLPAVLTDPLRAMAEQAASVTGTCYAGVDIIMDEAGEYTVLEVNSIPAWRGLQSVCRKDIAELLVEDFLRHLSTGGETSATAV